jgi:two-component system, LytTR family, sensor kinase
MQTAWEKVTTIARAYLWSILGALGFSTVAAAEDKVRLLERGLTTAYWQLLMVNGAWLVADAVLTPPIFAIVRAYPVGKPAGVARATVYVLGSIPFVIATACVRWLLLPPWDSPNQRFAHRSLHGLVHSTFVFAGIIMEYFLIVVAAHAYQYFVRIRDQEVERAQLEQALAASELQALKSQLHPHFLFNTLHGISASIDTNPVRAKELIVKVSSLLRTALKYGNADLITLDEELKFVEDYLDLEKARLENRMQLRWRISADTRRVLVPQLILQPLVENAVLHGVACCREGGWIEVASRLNEAAVEIQIQNSVGGKRQEGTGLGLPNTRARLKYLYSNEATLSFDLGRDGIATASLVLPAFSSRSQAVEGVAAEIRKVDGPGA